MPIASGRYGVYRMAGILAFESLFGKVVALPSASIRRLQNIPRKMKLTISGAKKMKETHSSTAG